MGPRRPSPKQPRQPSPKGRPAPTPKQGGTQGLRNHYANLQRQAGTGFTPPQAPAPTNPARPNLPGKFGRVDAAPSFGNDAVAVPAQKPTAPRMSSIGTIF